MLRSSLPNPAGEAEGLAREWGGGRNVVSVRRDRTSQDAHRASPRRLPKSGAVAPYPAWELAKWRYRAETGKLPGVRFVRLHRVHPDVKAVRRFDAVSLGDLTQI